MTVEFYPASVRRYRRSYPAIRIVARDANGGSAYEHKVYSDWRSFGNGAEARKAAQAMIDAPDFDAAYYVACLKRAWPDCPA